MKPYWQSEEHGLAIYCGDCLEILPQLEQEFDLCLTDPPYANATQYAETVDSEEGLLLLIEPLLRHAIRIANRVVLTPGVANMHLYPRPTWTMCWADPAGQGSGPWGFASWQPVLCYGKDPYLQAGLGRRQDTIHKRFLREPGLDHPCPKPIGFVLWLIERASLSGAIIDPFLGSGTTLAACYRLGRRGVGIEISEEYCELAKKRLEAELAQPRLFSPAEVQQPTQLTMIGD